MRHKGRIILGVGALLLPLTLVSTIGVGSAAAKGKSPQPGTVTCSKITGTFKFNPPLFATATSSSETVTVKSTATGCVAKGGLSPTKGTTVTTSVFTSNGCQAVLLAKGKPTTLTTKWSPGTITPSVVSFPAPTATQTPITISYGGAGTSATGSYTGTDGGASSKVTVDIAGSHDQHHGHVREQEGPEDARHHGRNGHGRLIGAQRDFGEGRGTRGPVPSALEAPGRSGASASGDGLDQLLEGAGAAEVEALGELAAHGPQGHRLGVGLDALAHDGEAQLVAEPDDDRGRWRRRRVRGQRRGRRRTRRRS